MHLNPPILATIALIVAALVGPRSAPAQAQTPFDSPRETVLGSPRVTVPLVKVGDFYFVDLTVNGRPFRFTIETGAAFSAVSGRLAQALGLRVDSLEIIPGSRDGVVVLDSITMGLARFRGITARVVPMFDRQGFDGIVSLPILREILATLDFGRSEMRLERGSLPEVNGRDIVEIVRQDRGGRLDVMMDVGGVRVPAVLDSRSFLWVVVPDSLEPRLRLAGEPRDIGQARGPSLGSFTLRGARLQGNARIGSAVFATPPLVLRNRPGVVLGAPLMERFAITIDQRNNRIRFTPGSSGPIVVASAQWETAGGPARQAVGQAPPAGVSGQRTMGFNIAGFPPQLRVLNVVPGSGAAKSGLKTDDQLVEFDGTPVESMSPAIFRAAAQRDAAVKVVVTRDGKRLAFEIIPYTTP